ncbi:MAG: hypothetical protein A4S09_14155 [Proteobacteria bacterium SG_bin7]|nr:MAG: hypothetical protein A4S09_14155 [Proteobacteria bacterium SG_bin7]
MYETVRKISLNIPESEESSTKNEIFNSKSVSKETNFATQKTNTKSLAPLISHISRHVRREKLNYDQLKYIFKEVRKRCEVGVPKKSLKLFELPTYEQLTAFYRAIKNPVHRLIFEVLEGTGLRIAELCDLQTLHIDFNRSILTVKRGKGGKDRVGVLGTQLCEKLILYSNIRENMYLFESRRNTKYSTRRIEQLCNKYWNLSGIKTKITPHTFRHIWNTRLAEAGISREYRALLAGHSNEKTQEIYTHLGLDGIKEKVIEVLNAHDQQKIGPRTE